MRGIGEPQQQQHKEEQTKQNQKKPTGLWKNGTPFEDVCRCHTWTPALGEGPICAAAVWLPLSAGAPLPTPMLLPGTDKVDLASSVPTPFDVAAVAIAALLLLAGAKPFVDDPALSTLD